MVGTRIASKVFCMFCLLLVSACTGKMALGTPVPEASETLLATYIPDQEGGFSSKWVVYVFAPTSENQDQAVEVEFNGTRMGPYTNLSSRVEVSPNGDHAAVAVEKDGKWVILLDGEEKWQHDHLGWAWWSWSPTMEGNSFIPQTQAAVMEFSPSGDTLAYLIGTTDDKWIMGQNGVESKPYTNIYLDFVFHGESLVYHATTDDGEVVVFGDKLLGPFKSIRRIKQSPNELHTIFVAEEKDGKSILFLDGEEVKVEGDITGYSVGDLGQWTITKQVDDQYQVYLENRLVVEGLDDIQSATLSPDGKHLAFWAKQGSQWQMMTDQNKLASGTNYFYYESGGIDYDIMWDPTSSHVAYFIQNGDQISQMVDGKAYPTKWEGIALQVYVNEEGETVGSNLMNGPTPDKQAFVACLLVQEKTNCDPFSSFMVGDQLAYREKSEEGSSLIIGDQKIGPYPEITGLLQDTSLAGHYGFVAKTELGYQVVMDGKLMDKVFDSIYLPRLVGKVGISFLGIKGDQIYGVFLPWP